MQKGQHQDLKTAESQAWPKGSASLQVLRDAASSSLPAAAWCSQGLALHCLALDNFGEAGAATEKQGFQQSCAMANVSSFCLQKSCENISSDLTG